MMPLSVHAARGKTRAVIAVCLLFFVFFICFVPAVSGQFLPEEALERYAQEQFEEVIALLEPERARMYAAEGVYQLLASAYMRAGQYDMALEVAAEGAGHYPRNADLRILEAEILAREQPKQGLDALERILGELDAGVLHTDHLSAPEYDSYLARIHSLAGQTALKLPRYDAAIRHFTEASERQPMEPAVHHQLLYAHLLAGQHRELLDAFDLMPSWMQDDRTAFTLRSQALLELQEVETLLELYRNRYEQDPDDLETAIVYGQLLVADNKLLKANDLYSDLIERHPRNRSLYDALMDLNRRQMHHRGMAVLLEQMVRNFPDDEELPLELAHARELSGDRDGAAAVYDSLLRHREPEYELVRRRALLNYRQGDAAGAYQFIREGTVEGEPALRLWDLAVLEFQLGHYAAAGPRLRTYLEQVPSDSLARMVHGRVLVALGKLPEAQYAFDQAASGGVVWPDKYQLAIRMTGVPEARRGAGVTRHTDTAAVSAKETVEVMLEALDVSLRELGHRENQLRIKAQLTMYGQPFEEGQPFYPIENQLLDAIGAFNALFDTILEFHLEEHIREMLERLIALHPENARVMDMAARFQKSTGNQVQALHYYMRAVEIEPDDHQHHLAIAAIMEERRDWEQAVLWYERALTARAPSEVYSDLIRVHRENGTLDQLIDRWLVRHRAHRADTALREYLIDALHRAGRREEAREIARQRQ